MSEIRKILIVDDEPQITRVLRHSLMAHRFDIRTAADGLSGLETFKDWRPDLVITDLGLPDRSGLELMPELKARQPVRGIATSGYGMEDDIAKCRAAGFDEHLTKPIKLDQLRRVIRRLTADVA